MLYEDFLEFAKPRLDDFFKNVTLFDNQFKFNEFNEKCYKLMYDENTYEDFKTVKQLKSDIEGLSSMCKECGKYYMQKNTKSILAYDLQMGILFENLIIDFLNQKCGIKAMHGDIQNKRYPDCMVLGKDKGKRAYFEVKYHSAPFLMAHLRIGRYCYEGSATLDQNKLIKQLEIVDSDIQLPVFILHWIDYPCLKGIFFETNEQVKDYLYNSDGCFERKEKIGDLVKSPESIYTKKVYSPLLNMGSFEEFIKLLKEMI